MNRVLKKWISRALIIFLFASFVFNTYAQDDLSQYDLSQENLSQDDLSQDDSQQFSLGEAPIQEAPTAEAPDISPAAATIIPMDRTRDIDAIVSMAKLLPHSGFNSEKTTSYTVIPRFIAPYSAGSLAAPEIADAQNALKMVRFLAGLPYDTVQFIDSLNNIAQHGAVLLSASDQFSHNPVKPTDMDSSFFDLALRGCSEANLIWGCTNISEAVLEFVADANANNIARAGHRRWVLQPGSENFGIGYASKNGIWSSATISMHVFDGPGPYGCESDSYVAWPNSGVFPIQYFLSFENINLVPPYPWSINLGSPYRAPSKNDIVLKLTRMRDNKVWIFDKNTPNLGETVYSDNSAHLAVDNDGYGMLKAIVFRPDVTSLGVLQDGDEFKIELSGIQYTDGSAAVLSYEIRFFDLAKEMNRSRIKLNVTHNGNPLSGATVTIDGQSLITDVNGLASLRVHNNTAHSYVVSKDGLLHSGGTVNVVASEIIENVAMYSGMIGDVNDSNTRTITDVTMIYQHVRSKTVLTGDKLAAADINGDGKVTITDVTVLYQYVRNKIASL